MPISTIETCPAYRHARRDLQVFRNCERVYTNLSNAFANFGFRPMPFKGVWASVISALSYIQCRVTPPRSASVGAENATRRTRNWAFTQFDALMYFVLQLCILSMHQQRLHGTNSCRGRDLHGLKCGRHQMTSIGFETTSHVYFGHNATTLLLDFPQQQQVFYSSRQEPGQTTGLPFLA